MPSTARATTSWSCSYRRTELTSTSTRRKPVRWKKKNRMDRWVDRDPASAMQRKAR